VEQVVTVGLGELAISDQPNDVLVAFGLGSCVGVAAYDPVRKICALLHAMLPTHRNGDPNRCKFVDSGVQQMLAELVSVGAKKDRLIWRYAGGAQMLTAPGLSDRFNIGAQNVAMTDEMTKKLGLRVLAQDTGGYQGRTVRVFVATGITTVRSVSGQEHPL
jgi:chemotaxis protein CheD